MLRRALLCAVLLCPGVASAQHLWNGTAWVAIPGVTLKAEDLQSATLYAITQGAAHGSIGALAALNVLPSGEAPVYNTGHTAFLRMGDSRHDLPEIWPQLFARTFDYVPGVIVDAPTADGASFIATSQPNARAIQTNALAGYCLNNNLHSFMYPGASTDYSLGACVALGGYTVNRVAGAGSWWIDAIMAEAPEITDLATPGLMQGEVDFKSRRANTWINGLIFVLDSTVQPVVATAFNAASTNANNRWQIVYNTGDSGANVAMSIGTASLAPGSGSQPIHFRVVDPTTTAIHAIRLSATGDGFLTLGTDNGTHSDFKVLDGSVLVGTGNGFYVGANRVIGTMQTGWGASTGATPSKAAINLATATDAQFRARYMALEQLVTSGIGPHALLGP